MKQDELLIDELLIKSENRRSKLLRTIKKYKGLNFNWDYCHHYLGLEVRIIDLISLLDECIIVIEFTTSTGEYNTINLCHNLWKHLIETDKKVEIRN